MKNKIILKKISYLLLNFALITSFVSCDQVESVPNTNDIHISEISGTWVVQIDRDGVSQGNNTISTYNTGDNGTEFMWLDDQEHSWGLKAKVPINLEAMTFGGSDLEEIIFDVTVDISEGVIIKNGTTAPSGTKVDSLYFKAEFSDIPGEIWEYYGFKSTAKVGDLP